MKSIRTLAAAAASVVIAGALIVGVGLPANAAQGTFPPPGPPSPSGHLGTVYNFGPITPQGTGPSVPPLPSGYTPVMAVQFPSCATVSPVVTSLNSSTRVVPNSPGQVGTAYAALQSVLASTARSQTCTFDLFGERTIITEAVVTPAQYAALDAWYLSHAAFVYAGGGLGGGTSIDRLGNMTDYVDNVTQEGFAYSPDGWWITVRTDEFYAVSNWTESAANRLLQVSPGRR